MGNDWNEMTWQERADTGRAEGGQHLPRGRQTQPESEEPMNDYIVHFVRTEFYDVPVTARDDEAAFDLASEIMCDEHRDHRATTTELASWTATPIERVA
jgi:hypothetical protein